MSEDTRKLRAALTQVKVDHLNKRITLPIETHAMVENALSETASEESAKTNFGSAPPSSARPPPDVGPVCTCSYEDSEEMTRHAPLCKLSQMEQDRYMSTLLVADLPTANGHVYPRAVLAKAVEQAQARIQQGNMFGTLGSSDSSLRNVSHRVVGLEMKDRVVEVTVEPLATPRGKLLALALQKHTFDPDPKERELPFEFTANGFGTTVKREDGIVEVVEFDLRSVDATAKSPLPEDPVRFAGEKPTVRSELVDFHDHAIDMGFHDCEGIPGGCPVENVLREEVPPPLGVARLACTFPGRKGVFHLYLPVRDGTRFHAARLAGRWPPLLVDDWPGDKKQVSYRGEVEWNEESQSAYVDWDDGDVTEVDLQNGMDLRVGRTLTFSSLRKKGEKTQVAVVEVELL